MKRAHTFSHVVFSALTIAITVVVGFNVHAQLSASRSSTLIVGSADQYVLEDTFKLGQRVEPRVSPSHSLDRLLAVRPSGRADIVSAVDAALALGTAAYESRPQGERLSILKRVPRMERGDPPRA